MCQYQGETTNDWSHYVKTILYCPSFHHDTTGSPINEDAAAVEQSAASSTLVAVPPRGQNKGGRPAGTTNANKRAVKLARQKAVN